MFTKLMATYPTEGEELDSYNIGNTEITVFSIPHSVQYLYHMVPPEFKLPEEKYELLDEERSCLFFEACLNPILRNLNRRIN